MDDTSSPSELKNRNGGGRRRFVSLRYVIIALVILGAVVGYVVLSQSTQGSAPLISNIENGRLSLSGWPSGIALDTNASTIYVSDLLSNKLSIINESNYALIGEITLPGANATVGSIAVDSRTNVVYVSVGQNTYGIVELNGNTNRIIGGIPVYDTRLLAIDQNTDVLWATSFRTYVNSSNVGTNEYSLLAIDASTGTLVANISLNEDPLSLSVDSNDNMIYMSACATLLLACQGAEVMIVNGTSFNIQSSVSLPSYNGLNFPVVVNPLTNTVYVMGIGRSGLQFASIDGNTGRIQTSSTLGSSCAGAGGGVLALNPSNNEVYALFDSYAYFLVIDGSSGKVVNMLNITGFPYFPRDVVYDSQMHQIYITEYNEDNGTGNLWVVPSNFGNHTFVNLNLLPSGTCLP